MKEKYHYDGIIFPVPKCLFTNVQGCQCTSVPRPLLLLPLLKPAAPEAAQSLALVLPFLQKSRGGMSEGEWKLQFGKVPFSVRSVPRPTRARPIARGPEINKDHDEQREGASPRTNY